MKIKIKAKNEIKNEAKIKEIKKMQLKIKNEIEKKMKIQLL